MAQTKPLPFTLYITMADGTIKTQGYWTAKAARHAAKTLAAAKGVTSVSLTDATCSAWTTLWEKER